MKEIQEVQMAPRLIGDNAQLKSYAYPLNEGGLNMLTMMSHDLIGSLFAISATLKLLSCGHYGGMDEGAEEELKELFAKVTRLIGMSEECLWRVYSVASDSEVKQEVLDLIGYHPSGLRRTFFGD